MDLLGSVPISAPVTVATEIYSWLSWTENAGRVLPGKYGFCLLEEEGTGTGLI